MFGYDEFVHFLINLLRNIHVLGEKEEDLDPNKDLFQKLLFRILVTNICGSQLFQMLYTGCDDKSSK